MFKKTSLYFIIFSFSLFGSGCKESSEGDQTNDTLEAAISALSGVLDDQSNELITYNTPERSPFIRLLDQFITKEAYAATCTQRAIDQSCQNQNGETGFKSIADFGLCTIPGTSQTLDGSVSLLYSRTDCLLSAVNDSVQRYFDYDRTTPWGAKINMNSYFAQDFEMNYYGNGELLTRTASGFDLEILGKHKKRTSRNSRPALDLSIRTTSPIQVSTLSRAGRQVDGGSLVVANNLKRYKISLSPNQLQFSNSCCYPTSGSIDLQINGSLSGSGSVSFNSECGSALLSKGGMTAKLNLYSCE